ncbi:hypothetical protein P692DRAFT_20290649 [Suillus brevipes Sb2]|nr:hypothetical protein P692DRAFT_20290649 [Suillus brevipes Sb2]
MVFPWLIRIVAMLRVRSSDLCNHCPPGRSGNRGASCLISTPSIVRRTNKVDKKPRGRDGVDGIDISVFSVQAQPINTQASGSGALTRMCNPAVCVFFWSQCIPQSSRAT